MAEIAQQKLERKNFLFFDFWQYTKFLTKNRANFA